MDELLLHSETMPRLTSYPCNRTFYRMQLVRLETPGRCRIELSAD